MTKRSMGIALAALACTGAVAAAFYFGFGGRFTSPHPPDVKQPDQTDKTKPDDEEPADATLYRPAPVSLSAASAPLFTGKSPRQIGLVKGALWRRSAAVLRGLVRTADGQPLAGVEVGVPSQPEVGRTRTGADGGFDLAVNGGGPIVVAYQKKGFLPAQRQVTAPWQDYTWLPDVVLVAPGAPAGALDLTADEAPPLRGPRVEDADGSRQATFLAPPGFSAKLFFADGDKLLSRLTLSVAEYSVGPPGAGALPALPPPGAGYAYAVELAADEAQEAGAREVKFNKLPLLQYVENFLKLPVGTVLPTGRYDPERSVWLPGPAGRVVKVLGVKDGLADLDLDGKDQPADAAALAALGVGEPERKRLAELYAKDPITLWRLPLTGLGSWAVLPALRPPEGAAAPAWPVAAVPAHDPASARQQAATETAEIPGAHLHLCYHSDRTPGGKAPCTLEVMFRGADAPKSLKRVDLEIQIAGRRILLPDQHGDKTTFVWDGLDAYGRPVQGRRPAVVRVGYVYDAAPPARQECVLWREQRVLLGDWDARAQALGGWTLNVHHSYDPIGRVLHFGGGGRREGLQLPDVVATVAGGTGVLTYASDDQPGVMSNLSQPRGLAVGPDGSLYIADAGQNRIRRVGPDGLIATVAGTGRKGYNGDNHPAVDAELNGPTGLAFGPDGSLYLADDGNNRVRRLRPDGGITAFAGRGERYLITGDGGPAVSAQMSFFGGLAAGPAGDVFITQNVPPPCVCRVAPDGVLTHLPGGTGSGMNLRTACAVAAAPDGVLYVADGDGCRVWRVGADGKVSVFAGTGKAGAGGDGGPAEKAELNVPSGLAVGPDGSVYIADAGNQRVRRVAPNGVITTFAGKGRGSSPRETGDDGPATEAVFRMADHPEPGVCRTIGLAVGPEGELYVGDVGHSSVRRVAPAFGGISDGEILLTSEDGAELYVFDGVGRHLRTLDAATGALKYRFVYDAAWRLKEVHDGSDAATKIERDKAGRPRAVVAADGQRTTLETGADGRLSRIAFPAGEAAEMEYDAGGLLTSFKDITGNVAKFRYDDGGRLLKE